LIACPQGIHLVYLSASKLTLLAKLAKK